MRIQEIYLIILGECFNGCVDAESTREYFKRRAQTTGHNDFALTEAEICFVKTLNFAAIRELSPRMAPKK